MDILWFILGFLIILALTIVGCYNSLISTDNQCLEARSNLETELKRRYDLIPNLMAVVKGYALYEKELLERVIELREKAANNYGSIASKSQDEIALQRALDQLIVRLEAYPDLKASQNFLQLQNELANTENRIQAALRFYNGNVRENHNKLQQFPSNIIAGWFPFRMHEFFELDIPAARKAPKIDWN